MESSRMGAGCSQRITVSGGDWGCKLRSLWISKGISRRMPASSQSQQIYFFGALRRISRRSRTAPMTMLPWKLAVSTFANKADIVIPP